MWRETYGFIRPNCAFLGFAQVGEASSFCLPVIIPYGRGNSPGNRQFPADNMIIVGLSCHLLIGSSHGSVMDQLLGLLQGPRPFGRLITGFYGFQFSVFFSPLFAVFLDACQQVVCRHGRIYAVLFAAVKTSIYLECPT